MADHARSERRRCRLQVEQLESRSLPSRTLVWTVLGDRQPGNLDDMIVIERDQQQPQWLQAVVNGEVVSKQLAGNIAELRIYAGKGNDHVEVNVSNRATRFRVSVFGGAGDDYLIGTNGSDLLVGGVGGDFLEGAGGRDRLRGGQGDDMLDGGSGRDWLNGGAGDDSLYGGQGGDQINGGLGSNILYGHDPLDLIVDVGDHDVVKDPMANPLHQVASLDQLRAWVVQNSVSNWSSWFGQQGIAILNSGPWRSPVEIFSADGVTTLSSLSGAPVSATNTQESGVDEADILKTDGQYLYTVVNGELLVIDARNPDQLAIVGRVALTGSVQAFYLMGSRAVVLSYSYEEQPWDNWIEPPGGEPGALDVRAASLASWWRPYYFQPQTVVTTIDVAVPTAPAIVHTATLDGSLVDSRAVDDRIYVVIQNNLSFPRPELKESPDGPVFESEAEYRARLDAAFIDALPGFATMDYNAGGSTAGAGSLLSAGNLYLPENLESDQFVSIAIFDPAATEPAPVAITTIAGTSGEVYASMDSLYIAATDYVSPWRDVGPATQIYKFALDRDAVPLDAVGVVQGTVLDQFSMDDEAGFFRIATTSGWGAEATNAIYVLADTGTDLNIVGTIQDLAPTERIYSVRFEGETGYVVTFRQVDPLFTLDLSDPGHPHVVGELKIPGYSSYLQTVGDGLLIGLGRDADPATGRVRGLQLSLFNVADLAHPLQVDLISFSLDAWGGWSEAEWDHHAISYFADVGILTLPVATDWDKPAKLEVIHVSAAGLELVGEIAHDAPVQRSLRIGDLLFSMSMGSIQAHSLGDPSVLVGSVDLPMPPPVTITPVDDNPTGLNGPPLIVSAM